MPGAGSVISTLHLRVEGRGNEPCWVQLPARWGVSTVLRSWFSATPKRGWVVRKDSTRQVLHDFLALQVDSHFFTGGEYRNSSNDDRGFII